MTTNPPATERITTFTYVAPNVLSREINGRSEWELGERIEWHVLTVDGAIVGRRRTRAELSELLRGNRFSGS